MQLTKQQKIYAAVLALAVAAFAFDRWVLGPGETDVEEIAVAGKSAPRKSPARPAATAAAPVAASLTATPQANAANASASLGQLASRLQRVAKAQKLNPERVGDAFRPSPVWLGAVRQTTATTELVDAVKEFQNKNHKLTMVIKQSHGGIAVIDGITLAVGQSFDGFRLVAVKDASAVLRRGTQKVEIRIQKDDGLAGAGTTAGAGTSEKFAGTGGGN